MNFKIAILTLVISTNISACATSHSRGVSSHVLPSGERMGLHGMVIFGKGAYFIEHIPMLHPPHDYQVVASIQIKNQAGEILAPDLSLKGHTIKPKDNFSLNDFIQGDLKRFNAELYQGSFEQDGVIVLGYENVVIEIQKIQLARKLPSASKETYFEVSDLTGNVFRTNIITPENSMQSISNVSIQKRLWCVVGPDFFEACD